MSRSPSRPRRAARLALACVSLLVATVVAELALRALDLPGVDSLAFLGSIAEQADFVADDQLFWRLRQGGAVYEANEHGLRGPWPRRARNARDLRVVCVGDSCAFGAGVRLEDGFGYRLEGLLQDALPGRNVAATLLACPGYSTDQDRVLVERHLGALRPDVTVFYVGAWNDYVPAIGASDAERRASTSAFRLVRLVRKALGRGGPRPGVDYRAEFDAGRAPDGRRVPPADFRRNLEAMLAAVRAAGSRAVFVLPPLPDKTLRDYPASAPYRAALRELGARDGVVFVDAQRAFERCRAAVPEAFRRRDSGQALLFDDWVHPSVHGHRVVAEAVFAALRPALAGWRLDPVAAGPTFGAPRPRVVTCPVGEVAVRWSFRAAAAAPVERVWLGRHPVTRFAERGGGLEVVVPRDLPPGEYPLRVATGDGVFAAPAGITLAPAALQVDVRAEGAELVWQARVQGPPGARVDLWFGAARASPVLQTPFGPFGLEVPVAVRPPRDDLPLLFEKIGLPRVTGEVGADGRARLGGRVPRDATASTARLFMQATVVREHPFGPTGYVTEVVAAVLPR